MCHYWKYQFQFKSQRLCQYKTARRWLCVIQIVGNVFICLISLVIEYWPDKLVEWPTSSSLVVILSKSRSWLVMLKRKLINKCTNTTRDQSFSHRSIRPKNIWRLVIQKTTAVSPSSPRQLPNWIKMLNWIYHPNVEYDKEIRFIISVIFCNFYDGFKGNFSTTLQHFSLFFFQNFRLDFLIGQCADQV